MFDTGVQDIDRLKHENSELKGVSSLLKMNCLRFSERSANKETVTGKTMTSDATESSIAERVRI